MSTKIKLIIYGILGFLVYTIVSGIAHAICKKYFPEMWWPVALCGWWAGMFYSWIFTKWKKAKP